MGSIPTVRVMELKIGDVLYDPDFNKIGTILEISKSFACIIYWHGELYHDDNYWYHPNYVSLWRREALMLL